MEVGVSTKKILDTTLSVKRHKGVGGKNSQMSSELG
jgi:hypothetical protein